MAVDLGIAIPSGRPSIEASLTMFSVEEAILRKRGKTKPMRQPDSEERRAFLGAYYVSSTYVLSIGYC